MNRTVTPGQGALRRRPSRQDEARTRLRSLAHQLGPEAKLPTITELRLSLGVSMATLSAALEDLEAQNVISRRHGVGVFVSPRLHRNIVLLCNSSFFRSAGHSPFWDMMVDAASARARERSETFSCHFTLPESGEPGNGDARLHHGLKDEIASGQVQGVLGIGLDEVTARWIEAQGVPFVAFAGPAQARVRLDGAALVNLGVQSLARRGCRRIGYWTYAAPARKTNEQHLVTGLQLFQEALKACGVPFDPALVQNNSDLHAANDYTEISQQEQGYRAAMAAYARPERPDGVFSDSDMVTHGALTALRRLEIVPGRDVQIASHVNRNSAILMGYENQMTLLEIDPHEVVQRLFAVLDERMTGAASGEQVQYVFPKLRERSAFDAPV